MTRALPATLGAVVGALTLWYGGAAGLLYLALVAATMCAALPLGWRLFGRDHPAGWIAGATISYSLVAIAFWVPIAAGLPRPLTFALAGLVVTGVAWWGVGSRPAAAIALPVWTSRDTAAWLLLLHLILAFLALPFGRVGERDPAGTKYYRAYFTADFLWHTALTQEIARFDSPPINPYLAPSPIHYYWAYYVPPAVLAGPESAPLLPMQSALKINALAIALCLSSLIFFAAQSACGSATAAVMATILSVVAASLEGTYALIDLLRRGQPLSEVRQLNIDAITAWPPFNGLRIDSLLRSMWYTPQHSTSMALGLVGVLAAVRLGGARPIGFALTGVALGLSVAMNPFLGAAFCMVYGIAVALTAASDRTWRPLLLQTLVVVPVVLGLGWTMLTRMAEGGGAAVMFGYGDLARNAPVAMFVLSLGGVALPAGLGLLPWRSVAWRPAVPGVAGLIVGLFLLYFVRITELAWVSFRAGNVLLVTLPILAARAFVAIDRSGRRQLAVALFAALVLLGAPTTVIDTFNAQDIENRQPGPGFLWTIPITLAQQQGFEYLRRTTPPTAIVQMDPIVRGRQNWTIIPSFAGRRMAAGLPISLLAQPEYERRSQLVHRLFTELPPADAHAEARRLGIGWLWLDQDDGAAAGRALEQFSTRPDLFTIVFRIGPVTIVEVK